MRGLPSGTVTFLFTDVERSTETVEELGDARYADVQEAHRKLLRDAFAAHDGVEVSTEGDAFFVAFARAGDAVAAAIAGQRALAGQPLAVRMGLHTGEALVRDDDYVGHDVHKAKRVSDAGHGGQILLSHSTAELVRGSIELRDLGAHRLKDLGEPQHLFQVKAEGLKEAFPPLRTLDAAQHNLPVQLTSFVGRERELEEIRQLLAKYRLLTLTGVGGCGKTRLAIHAAVTEVESSPDGVFFCDLSRLADEDALVPAIARALGLELTSERALSQQPDDAVRNFLSRRNAFLVLDNCEHLIGSVAEFVEDLLTSCPQLRILATSREALDVAGEHTWPIPSLEFTGEAVQLFVERAEAVRGGFALTEANRADVEKICERLDGIPLAIELAAAQSGHLGPRQIAERLDQRFMILTGGRRRVQRQQTLQAAMDWSWDLLDERDQTLLRRLAVFQGGCTLDAAEAVCGDGLDVVSGLRSLVSKSLVNVQQTEGEVRYRLLETVRLYAEDKQAESGESEDVRTKHRDHYLAWLESIPLERTLFGDVFEGSELLPEEDNIRAALRWSEARGEYHEMARILAASRRLWIYHHAEAPRWFESALAHDHPAVLRARLLLASVAGVPIGGVQRNLDAYDAAVPLLRDSPDPWLVAGMGGQAITMALWALLTSDAPLLERAAAIADEAVGVAAKIGPFWESTAHTARGSILLMRLRHEEAAEAFASCCRLALAEGLHVTYVTLDGVRAVRHILGERWSEDYESLFRSVRQRGHPRVDKLSPLNVSVVVERETEGNAEAADAYLRHLLEFTRDRAPANYFSMPFAWAGAIAGMRGDFERAARLLSAAMKWGWIASSGAWAVQRHWVPRVREALGAERARQLRDEGRAMSVDEAIDYILDGLGGA